MKTILDNSKAVNGTDLESKIKAMYKNVAEQPDQSYHFEMGRGLAEHLGYSKDILNTLPEEAIASFAGVGYFFDLAGLKPGEQVADFGSGSGMDVFYAAKQVGEQGHVYGLDMTDQQLDKSIRLKKLGRFTNVTFIKGYIENSPFKTNNYDVVISNGVFNLSRSKELVFKEVCRVLKPGGRLVLSDIVSAKSFPSEITCNPTLWAACVAGAMQIDLYLELIEKAGLKVQMIKENPYNFISQKAQNATRNYGIQSLSILAIKED